MGMMIVCLRGGEGRSDLCRLLLGKLENPFSKSPVSLTEGKVYIIFMYPPGLDSPSRLYYRQHAIYRHSEHVRQSGLSASVSVCG